MTTLPMKAKTIFLCITRIRIRAPTSSLLQLGSYRHPSLHLLQWSRKNMQTKSKGYLTSFAIYNKHCTPKVCGVCCKRKVWFIYKSGTAIGENLLSDVKQFKWDWVYKIANDLKMSSMKANVLWIGMRGVVTPGKIIQSLIHSIAYTAP